ncbi:hypothetical protein C2G38_2186348 [Gigaspora rosea]|uniref:Uncharacterized protein n=1 Tax=Gigaspora rosea TaxID=44941 RepID=A0A397V5P2_9GLOM|nr:hypothetical protein C2G38_2186348 [Gigaspora rosea]
MSQQLSAEALNSNEESNKSDRYTAEEMHTELLELVKTGNLEESDVLKVSTIQNWIGRYATQHKQKIALHCLSPPATDDENSLMEDKQVEASSSKRGRKRKRALTTSRTTKKGKRVALSPGSIPDSLYHSHTSESYQEYSQQLAQSQDNSHPTSQDNPPVPSLSLPPTQPQSEDTGHYE